MNKTKIEWADYTWNPVTGCPNGCKYCYARRIHNRFNKTPYSDVVYHPDRIHAPSLVSKPTAIFVGSMSDIFFWKREWIENILLTVGANPKHKFLFLSKNPRAYRGIDWPKNCWIGLTMTKIETEDEDLWLWGLKEGNNCKNKFLSLEPLQGFIANPIPKFINLVICGAMTGPGAQAPEREWVDSVYANVPSTKLFWKGNMDRYRS